MEAHTWGSTKGTQIWTGRKGVWIEGVESANERQGVKVYLTGHTSWVVSVYMELLVRRGTSWHKGVVVIIGSKCCWVANMFLSHTPPRGGQEQSACMCVRV